MGLNGYESVMERATAALARAGRRPGELTVVAVSKGRSVEEIEGLYKIGHRDFGENRAAEMAEKAAALPGDIRWHFVGSLQSNKARLVRRVTFLLHSLDRPSLAKAWVKGPDSPPPVTVQVNIGREDQKGGVDPAQAMSLAQRTVALGIEVVGVMGIPPLGRTPEDSRPYFAELRTIGESLVEHVLVGPALSMGMSDDFEVAIEEGASIIRVGRAIFETTS